eukprot:scaffold14350_cov98-Isochrysis_galbana.AAC.3
MRLKAGCGRAAVESTPRGSQDLRIVASVLDDKAGFGRVPKEGTDGVMLYYGGVDAARRAHRARRGIFLITHFFYEEAWAQRLDVHELCDLR